MCVINLPPLSKRLVEDQRYLEKKEHIREEHNIKRIERKTKYDDIKRKYGELYNYIVLMCLLLYFLSLFSQLKVSKLMMMVRWRAKMDQPPIFCINRFINHCMNHCIYHETSNWCCAPFQRMRSRPPRAAMGNAQHVTWRATETEPVSCEKTHSGLEQYREREPVLD